MQGNLLHSANTGLGKRTSQAPERVDFSKISTAVRIPNLIEIQRESYNRFLQMDFLPEERENTGLQAVFISSEDYFCSPRFKHTENGSVG